MNAQRWSPRSVGTLVAAAGVMVLSLPPFTSQLRAQPRAASESVSHAKALSQAFREASRVVLPTVVTVRQEPTATAEAPASPRRPEEPRTAPSDPFRGSPFEDLFRDRDLRRFFDELPAPRERQGGSGTGFIIDASGIVVTNNHVVAGSGPVRVRLSDGREFRAVKVKRDPRTDLAVVWIEGAGTLAAARFGDSSRLDIGDWVLAIGHPFGLSETVTAGIISAKGRGLGVTQREEFLQTDAAINPGNSGGPLINLDGEVVGINTAISSRSGGYQGVGFAIPVNLARWVVRQLIDKGSVSRAYLGAAIQPITPQLADQLGVPPGKGVLLAQVMQGTPAEAAGLKEGDVVLSFAGSEVNHPRELQGAVERSPIDSGQPVEILRDGKPTTLRVTVRKQPEKFGLTERRAVPEEGPDETASAGDYGFEVGPLTEEAASRLELAAGEGVLITGVDRGGPAALAGLAPGMAITQVNRTPVGSIEAFQAALRGRPPERGVLLLVRTPEGSRFIALRTSR